MGIWDKLFKRDHEDVVLETSNEEDVGQPIATYTANGEKVIISRNYWRLTILPEEFRKAWKTPDALYAMIVDALQNDFPLETLGATARLVAIDGNKERAYNIRGISLLKNRRLEEATGILDEYLSEHGQSGVILCNLAKVWAERKEQKKAEELLWTSLTVDPNQDNALIWWGAIHRERAGEDGFHAAMTEASGIPGSWRPQLWLARRALEKNDASGALAYYDAILSAGSLPGDALMQISGDLGNNGLGAESVRLLGTLYNPAKHGYLTGLNLIMTYIQLKRKKDGCALLAQLRNLKRHDITKHLDALEKQLSELSDVADNS